MAWWVLREASIMRSPAAGDMAICTLERASRGSREGPEREHRLPARGSHPGLGRARGRRAGLQRTTSLGGTRRRAGQPQGPAPHLCVPHTCSCVLHAHAHMHTRIQALQVRGAHSPAPGRQGESPPKPPAGFLSPRSCCPRLSLCAPLGTAQGPVPQTPPGSP